MIIIDDPVFRQPKTRRTAPWATRRQLRDLRAQTGLTRPHKIYAHLTAMEKQRRKEMQIASSKKHISLSDVFRQMRAVLSRAGKKPPTLQELAATVTKAPCGF